MRRRGTIDKEKERIKRLEQGEREEDERRE